jgi:hypothetical protein
MISRLVYYILGEYRLYICDLYSDNEVNNDTEQRPWINYKQTRTLLIKTFSKIFIFIFYFNSEFLLVKLQEFSKGKQLAEEFEDYLSLIEICDELKDTEQLRTYIEQYKDKVIVSIYSKIKKKLYFSLW